MSWLTNEQIFYSGIAILCGTFLLLVVAVIFLKRRKIKLGVQLEKEYGEKSNK